MKAKENIDKQLDLFLDDVLKTAPDATLSSDFAEKIKSKVYQTFAWKHYLGDFFMAVALVVFSIGLGLGVLFFVNDSTYVRSILNIILTYKSILLIVFGLITFLFFYNYVLLNFMLFYYKNKLANK